MLARLPLVPGLEPRMTAELRGDDRRLDAEGFLVGIEQELFDLAGRRIHSHQAHPPPGSKPERSRKRPSCSTNFNGCPRANSSRCASPTSGSGCSRTIPSCRRRSPPCWTTRAA